MEFYLLQERQLKQKKFRRWQQKLPSLDVLDRYGLRLVSVGFGLYTISLILGIYHGWQLAGVKLEPRTALSVLTWVVYAIIIQGRITAGLRGRKASKMMVFGALSSIAVVLVYLLRNPG